MGTESGRRRRVIAGFSALAAVLAAIACGGGGGGGGTSQPVNQAPEAKDEFLTTEQDTPIAVTLAATDPDNDSPTFEVTVSPPSGTISGTGSTLTYTPNAGFNGVDTFTFTAADGKGGTDTGTISIGVGYHVRQVTAGTNLEARLYRVSHHYLTVVTTAANAVALRPHPGVDPNGWGSTLYFHAFLPAAVLGGAQVQPMVAGPAGIQVQASGPVNAVAAASYGTWGWSLTLSYDPALKRVSGAGTYSVTLNGLLAQAGDLNLYKIASNYLDDVPLLTGQVGDTGDMERADVAGVGFSFSWSPPLQPSHFPQDRTDTLAIDVIGQYNQVDTAAQGYDPIQAAYKPSLAVTLASAEAGIPMIFGAVYDTAKSKDFWEDNVGITPVILRSSPQTAFQFTVEMRSTALPGDGP